LSLIFVDVADALFHCGGHSLVHGGDVVAFDEIGGPAVPEEEVLELFVADAGQDCRVVDLWDC
jgi:hypothetical protein